MPIVSFKNRGFGTSSGIQPQKVHSSLQSRRTRGASAIHENTQKKLRLFCQGAFSLGYAEDLRHGVYFAAYRRATDEMSAY